jgi:hypothetical protein
VFIDAWNSDRRRAVGIMGLVTANGKAVEASHGDVKAMYGVSTKNEDTETGEHAMWKMRPRNNAMSRLGKVRAGQVSVAPRRNFLAGEAGDTHLHPRPWQSR